MEPSEPTTYPSGVLKQERQRRIRQLIEEQGQVRVVDLARQFGVAEMTIRRDLEEMDAEGIIVRTHGGGRPT